MFQIIPATALVLATSSFASAYGQDSRVHRLCGADHANEMVGSGDITMNPNGYYIASLREQVSLDDPRIMLTNAVPHLCSRPASTPDMNQTRAILNAERRIAAWLFVPFHPMGQ